MHPTDPKRILAYGDREGDGVVQMSFVLAIPPSARAREAAKRYAQMHGIAEPLVTTMEEIAEGYSYFVVYGQSKHVLDISAVEVPEVRLTALSHAELELRVANRLGRRIVVVGACTGSDAHTVGIDAILNYKGYAGDKGLESYRCFEVHNLGAQVENEELAARARALGVDAILVSQVVTQRNCHKDNSIDLVARLRAQGIRDRIALVLGGPRIDHTLALELGFDAGFGTGSKPSDVANWLVDWVCGDEG
jgi:beta-lysine 5,6-aminomutase beta subunit